MNISLFRTFAVLAIASDKPLNASHCRAQLIVIIEHINQILCKLAQLLALSAHSLRVNLVITQQIALMTRYLSVFYKHL
jgi:hypothetical protein